MVEKKKNYLISEEKLLNEENYLKFIALKLEKKLLKQTLLKLKKIY